VKKDESKKSLFTKFLKLVKENEILRTQFLAYTNIEGKVESDRNKAADFVDETIDLFSKFKKKEILEANKLLIADLINEKIDNKLKELHENVSRLIFLDKKPETVEARVEAKANVIEYILGNKARVVNEAIELPSQLIISRLVDWFNEKYSTINESDKEVIKQNLIAQLTGAVKWTQSVQAMAGDGATHFTECGPGKVLQGLVQKIYKEAMVAGLG
jgi:adenylate kinase family enzyme